MSDRFSHLNDLELALKCLSGDEEAAAIFQSNHRSKMVAFVKKRGANEEEANEAVIETLSDCISGAKGKRPKLVHYNGACALQTWLNTVAWNCFLSRIRDDPPPPPPPLPGPHVPPEEGTKEPTEAPVLHLLRTAVEAAFQQCAAEDFVLLQLKHCDLLKGEELSVMFGCDEPTISRRLKEARRTIKDATLEEINKLEPGINLQWEDFVDLCRTTSPTWFEEN